MIKNYLTGAFRNLWRERASTIINLSGLTLGIASSLVLFLLIRHHTTFDQFHSNKDRIYRVVTDSDGNNGRNHTAGVPPLLPDAFRNDFPDAEEVSFISYRYGSMVTVPQNQGAPKKYDEEKGVAYAEPNFFRIFDREIILGEVEKGLIEPNTVVISVKLAKKYFNKEDVVGEVVRYDNHDFKVIAVMEDFPSNTDFPFELMFSMSTIKKEEDEKGWGSIWSDEHCYILLKDKVNIESVRAGMDAFYKKHHTSENRSNQAFSLQALNDIHFNDDYGNYNYSTISQQMLMALGVIAIFLVVTACINFINITTAEAVKRSKEVGIRKSLGSSRWQLIGQFLGETSLVTGIALILAVSLSGLALTFLNPFLELNLSLKATDITLWLFIISIGITVALLSGFYPSWMVSGFKVTQALKNQVSIKNSSGMNLRRGLVVAQFFISQFFIIGTIVLISQMNFFQSKELGFRKDAIISVPIPVNEAPVADNGVSKMRTLRNEVSDLAGVEMASLNNTPPSSGSSSGTDFSIDGTDNHIRTQVKTFDDRYVDLFGLTLLAGKNIDDQDTARGFLVNEKLAKTAGFQNPADIVGKRIRMWGKNLPVDGVIKDFHTASLRNPIEPIIMLNRIRSYETLSVRLKASQAKDAIGQIQKKWETAYPEFIFSYEYLDDEIRDFYESESKMSILLTVFTSMAIFIGCLGLFGLTTFMANQKTKEIGVRKVLGASVESIVFLFSKEFIVLIGAGFILAAPLAWFIMNQWLNEFAYKITIGPFVFVLGIGITMLIALATVGYRSYRAATVNPARSLKSE